MLMFEVRLATTRATQRHVLYAGTWDRTVGSGDSRPVSGRLCLVYLLLRSSVLDSWSWATVRSVVECQPQESSPPGPISIFLKVINEFFKLGGKKATPITPSDCKSMAVGANGAGSHVSQHCIKGFSPYIDSMFKSRGNL